ncbi:effector-associated domain EAD1-containing protein [Aetokthonos hydrillicola Thurmond2011]|jgi:GTPase SAR1 family protein|uniref:Effector-associated domain EAD1-containing protein n=1 Tax=Aetokthonos hydrillicola Thurmond2011 TaxID=2712845 RepID=A0AAP5IBG4_9CYAN|nr:effector-associated domain EAD1-containing protein [Aetokthonos hydrillicola]MBO3461985.1 NACHT domain-containing protein [Aetokthonos hydrillicola CCALA 1050]MBW4584312.1 NACHT domain-containing protein [Aetokthonos hydrillicola CCALA 1050]MDR9898480.1 effector-associated domain EAD1-containing protein [Aetokthonos hydrillicola Thurmond2011]
MKNIELSGKQRQELESALIDAFPTTLKLERMLSFGLERNLRAIAGEGSLQDIVFRLIQVAESQGWLEDLICAALNLNPRNARLRDVARELIPNYLKGSSEALSSAEHSRIRQDLLKRVNSEVKGRIKSSLHNQVYVVLDVEQNPSRIELPWEGEIKVPNKPKILLKDTDIITVFDEPDIEGRLLILGQPGSGKTTMLLKLAEALVERAKDEFTSPIPVLFSLSSWKNDNQNIKDWLVVQLNDKYGLRKDISKQWVENQDIIPLLDGLDEIAAECQEKCILKINEFLHPTNWNNPVVVCSRTEEYQIYKRLLQLNNSLELHSFTSQQVYQYLESTNNLQLLHSISQDDYLNELAKIPFFLNIIVISAQEISLEKWQRFKCSKERLNHLFDAYVNTMLQRPYKGGQPKPEKTKKWLSWLAQRLIEENTTEFFIEKIQPDWLNNNFMKFVYTVIVWIPIGTLILVAILVIATMGTVLAYAWTLRQIITLITQILERISRIFKPILLLYKLFALISGSLIFIDLVMFDKLFDQMSHELITYKIQPVEIIDISINTINNFFKILITWLILGLITGSVLWWAVGNIYGLSGGLIYGLTYGLIYGLIYELNGTESVDKTIPNQSIRKSFVNTIIISLSTFLLVSILVFIGLIVIGGKPDNIASFSLLMGLFFGVFIGISKSGTPAIKHFVLRVILWSSDYAPWNYAKFLDYCTDRLFLQRVGGGYRFMHDLLRQHFAKSYKQNS